MACNCNSTPSSSYINTNVVELRKGSTEKLGIVVSNLPDCTIDDCSYCIDLWVNASNKTSDVPVSGVQHYTKNMTVLSDDDLFIVELKTSLFETGYLVGRIVIDIPDSDLPSEWRKSIEHFVCNIKIV